MKGNASHGVCLIAIANPNITGPMYVQRLDPNRSHL